MPEPARRARAITGGGSDGWDLFYRARALAARGEPVIELTIGEPDFGVAPAILDAMDAAARAGETGYAVGPGLPELRAAIAARAERMTGVPTRPEEVHVTVGGQGALFAAHMAVLDEGDRALMVDPYYATYPGTIRAVGAEPVPVAAPAASGFTPDPAAIDAAAAEARARSLLINTPNNPTGRVYDRATLAAIGEVARARELWLISDEVYDAQVWSGGHRSARALPGLRDRVIAIGSMSKIHAMTGFRVGWLIAPPEIVRLVSDLSICMTYAVPAFIQRAAARALAGGAEAEARVAAPFRRRRDLALEVLRGAQALRVIPAEGAMYVMLDIRPTGLDDVAFAERLLEEERIAVMPGSSFGAAAGGHLRVALTRPDDELAEALGRIRAFAERVAAGG